MYNSSGTTSQVPEIISVMDTDFQSINLNNENPSILFYPNNNRNNNNTITKVVPAPPPQYSHQNNNFLEIYDEFSNNNIEIKTSRIFNSIKPIFLTLRILGIFPISQQQIKNNDGQSFQVSIKWIIYSLLIFLSVAGFLGYLKYEKISVSRNAEGRFEEAVIDYLFTVYLIPIVINLISIYEAKKQANVLTQMISFERIYSQLFRRRFSIDLGGKPMVLSLVLVILGAGVMMITHFTMANVVIYLVIPYCYINIITYILGGAWYVYCDLIGEIASVLVEEFQIALKNIEYTNKVADYRSLWMILSKIIRNVGNAFGYQLTFLCLYLFFVITLTIYGLLSQIQEGMDVKDVGLTITGFSAIFMLYFICDKAHYASTCVRSYFQKKILLVELSFMNEAAQQEINMFLRATEMNPTDMCLCGFFDVNRNLFKSLLATMVTYLVVLLQFQISIPSGDNLPVFAINSTLLLNSTTIQ